MDTSSTVEWVVVTTISFIEPYLSWAIKAQHSRTVTIFRVFSKLLVRGSLFLLDNRKFL